MPWCACRCGRNSCAGHVRIRVRAGDGNLTHLRDCSGAVDHVAVVNLRGARTEHRARHAVPRPGQLDRAPHGGGIDGRSRDLVHDVDALEDVRVRLVALCAGDDDLVRVNVLALLRQDGGDVESGAARQGSQEQLGRPWGGVSRLVVHRELMPAAGANREAQPWAGVARACRLDHGQRLLEPHDRLSRRHRRRRQSRMASAGRTFVEIARRTRSRGMACRSDCRKGRPWSRSESSWAC